MKKLLVFLCAMVLGFASVQAQGEIIYDNFGPEDSYGTVANSIGDIGTVAGNSFSHDYDTDLYLTEIEAAVALRWGPNELYMWLMTDDNNKPGTIIETFRIIDQMGPFDGSFPPPVKVNSTLNPVISSGQKYWLIASVPESSAAGWYFNSTGDEADRAQSHIPIESWYIWENYTAAAFRIKGAPIFNVSVDIIPKTCPNEFSIKGGGSMKVAILGSVDFDVNNIDIESVRLEGIAPVRSSFKDKSSPVVPPPTECECTTEGRDGFLDLCLKFDKKAILSALSKVNVGDNFVLTLTGSLNDGTPIEGQDCIVIVKKGKKD